MISLALAIGLSAPALAGDPLIDTLGDEMNRSRAELSLPDAPDIYHLRYHLMQLDQVDVTASFGGLVRSSDNPFNALAVEVRVGTPEFDNTNFGGWQTGFGRSATPVELTPHALSLAAWRLTDGAYKEAVEQYARKEAQFNPPPDYPGDYTLTDTPAKADLGRADVSELAPWQDLARQVSGAMAIDPRIERAGVWVGHEGGSIWTIDTEGTHLQRPLQETTVRAAVHVRAADGMLLTDHRLWTAKGPDGVPSASDMAAEARAMAAELLAIADAPTFDDEYVGPVIFEDHAAVDIFRYLLLPQIEGTPGEIPFDTWLGDIGDADDPVRLGRRVLPLGWSSVDDPMRDPEHPSSFEYDLEGTPAERVDLIQDGIVRQVLMSRIPRLGTSGSNGHARGMIGDRMSGRASQLSVSPDKTLSQRKLRKKALKIASSYGRDWVLVIRRLQEPAIRRVGGGFFFGDSAGSLPMPVSLVKVYADGREEEVRGAAFASVQRWVLRDILGAGDPAQATFMASASGGGFGFMGPTEGMPTWLGASDILVGEMEVVPAPGDPRNIPLVPPPALASAQE